MSEPGERLGEHGKGRRTARDDERGKRRERLIGELRRARPVARTTLAPGTVVYARIPYVERPDDSKSRPAVVTEVLGRTVRLLPITSSSKDSVRNSALYVMLDHWAAAGLNRPCLVSRRPVQIDIIDVTAVLGELSRSDSARVNAAGVVNITSLPRTAGGGPFASA